MGTVYLSILLKIDGRRKKERKGKKKTNKRKRERRGKKKIHYMSLHQKVKTADLYRKNF